MNILQSVLCLLREKNIITLADIEERFDKVAMRIAQAEKDPLPCCKDAAHEAATASFLMAI